MTEDVTVDNGRLKVARVEGKEDVDVDLSNVESVHYERSVLNGVDGALVLHRKDRPYDNLIVIRVDAEDAEDVYARVLDAVTAQHSVKTSGVSGDAPATARNSGKKVGAA